MLSKLLILFPLIIIQSINGSEQKATKYPLPSTSSDATFRTALSEFSYEHLSNNIIKKKTKTWIEGSPTYLLCTITWDPTNQLFSSPQFSFENEQEKDKEKKEAMRDKLLKLHMLLNETHITALFRKIETIINSKTNASIERLDNSYNTATGTALFHFNS